MEWCFRPLALPRGDLPKKFPAKLAEGERERGTPDDHHHPRHRPKADTFPYDGAHPPPYAVPPHGAPLRTAPHHDDDGRRPGAALLPLHRERRGGPHHTATPRGASVPCACGGEGRRAPRRCANAPRSRGSGSASACGVDRWCSWIARLVGASFTARPFPVYPARSCEATPQRPRGRK
jgi:hypothetical protein